MVPKCDRVWGRAQDARQKASQSAGAIIPSYNEVARVSGLVYPGWPGNGFEPPDRLLSGAQVFKPLEAPSAKALPCDQVPDAAPNSETSTCAVSAFRYDVLVAEDHPINLKLVVVLLQAAGCGFKCAANGAEALAEFEKADFDLIVMDSQMPVMTGIEAIETIRMRDDWKRLIPILSLTAHAMKGAEEYHTAAGADLYMSKPLQSDCFIGAVKSLAQRGRDLRVQNCSGGAGTLPVC